MAGHRLCLRPAAVSRRSPTAKLGGRRPGASAGEAAGLELPQLALRWVIENQTVSTALVGFRNPDEVAVAVAAAEADIPAAVMQEADAVTRAAYERMLADELPPADLGPLRRNA